MELLGRKASYPLTWSPGSPMGGCISSSGYLGQQAFPPSLSPSSSCPNPAGPRGLPIRPGLLQLCPEALDQTHPPGAGVEAEPSGHPSVRLDSWFPEQPEPAGGQADGLLLRGPSAQHAGSPQTEWPCKWS